MTDTKSNKSLIWRKEKGIAVLSKLGFKRRIVTLSGLIVRTRNEKRIADFLYKNGIAFEYEKEVFLNGKRYFPDFYLPELNLYIEFFGWGHLPDYQARVETKMKAYKNNGINCIYLFYKGSKELEKILEKELSARGMSLGGL